MAITTWTELKASVADFANRTDLTAVIPDLIMLAENRLYDLLLLKNMESDESLTLTLNQNYVALPTNYISPISFWLVVDSERLLLQPALPQELPYYTESSQPRYWAIDGANIRFDCPAQSAYTAYLRCMKKSNLGASVASNYLLDRRPDIYLSASMAELARYTNDAELFASWEARLQDAIAGFKASENRARGIVPLRSDVPVLNQRPNILRGDW